MMEYVGKTPSEEMSEAIIENITTPSPLLTLMKGQKVEPRPRRKPVRRTDYPPSNSQPKEHTTYDSIMDALISEVCIWRCGLYSKVQHGKRIWIRHTTPVLNLGGGHKALRRLGWSTQYHTDRWVWVHPIHTSPPWEVPTRDPHEECL